MALKGRYHHGDLRRALIQGAADLLREEGLAALSLRAVARRAGVSQTAPYRHFEDRAAILAAVAATGFRDFGAAMTRTAAAENHPRRKLIAIGRAYVVFALENPAMFRLMFGPEILEKARFAELLAEATAAFSILAETSAAADLANAAAGSPSSSGQSGLPNRARARWSVAHGLAMLLLDGQLTLPDGGQAARDAFIEGVLAGS